MAKELAVLRRKMGDNAACMKGVMPDISKGKYAIESLNKSEEVLYHIVMGNSIATFVINNDHRITHWNKACERLTGKTSTEVVGTKNQWSAFYSDRRPVLADLIVDGASMEDINAYYDGASKRSTLINGAYEAEGFFPELGRNGKWLFFTAAPLKDIEKRTIGAIETLQDFTEQRQAQENLYESEKRYRLLTENVLDGVGILQNRKLSFVNAAFVKILGYHSEKDLIGKNVIDFISVQYRKQYEETERAFRQGKIEAKDFHIECVKSDGTKCWIEARNNFIKWEDKPALLTTIRDITDRRLQELAIREEASHLKNENIRLKSKMKGRYGLGELIGKSKPMQVVYEHILKAASSTANVVIYGESGTGKELVARSIHEMSDRCDKEFIAVNCGAIPENLFESEFFGYKKGAFTGAVMDKSGYLESADGGTLFFDEVGEISLNMQVKLLRAIECRGFIPIGSTQFKKIDVRIVAATNRDLKKLVRDGGMREDFFYRIHVIPIQVPPLRHHKEDLALLIYHFLQTISDNGETGVIPERFIKAMHRYDWPGNVRELQNVMHRYHTFKTLDFLDISQVESNEIKDFEPSPHLKNEENLNLRSSLEHYEKRLLLHVLERNKGNRTWAAKSLGIERRSLQRKINRYGIAGVSQ